MTSHPSFIGENLLTQAQDTDRKRRVDGMYGLVFRKEQAKSLGVPLNKVLRRNFPNSHGAEAGEVQIEGFLLVIFLLRV